MLSSEVVLLTSDLDPESVERQGSNRNCTSVTSVWLPIGALRPFDHPYVDVFLVAAEVYELPAAWVDV